MQLFPNQLTCFVYCPILRKQEDIIPKLPLLESKVRASIINTERNCLLKNSDLAPRKFLRSWDNIWWPSLAANKISFKEGKNLSVRAAKLFTDYCKYEFADYLTPTAGVDIKTQRQIGKSILHSSIDIIKSDLTNKSKNTILIDLSRIYLDHRDVISDPAIRSIAYSFYSNRGEQVKYISIDLVSLYDKIKVSSAIFRPEDMEKIKKELVYLEYGIRNNIKYPNRWQCEVCRECDFSYLTKNVTHGQQKK